MEDRKPSRFWIIAIVGVICLALGFLCGVALNTAWMPGLGQWLRDFSVSPAFAGACAVVAALIAFVGLTQQTKAQMEESEKTRLREIEADQLDAWWRSFDWASSQVERIGTSGTQVPLRNQINSVANLESRAVDAATKQACTGLMETLIKVRKAEEEVETRKRSETTINEDPESSSHESGFSASSTISNPPAEENSEEAILVKDAKSWIHPQSSALDRSESSERRMEEELDQRPGWLLNGEDRDETESLFRSYALSTTGTAGESDAVTGRVYEEAVFRAIGRKWSLERGFDLKNGYKADAVLRFSHDKNVLIEVILRSDPEQLRRAIVSTDKKLSSQLPPGSAAIIVTPTLLPLALSGDKTSSQVVSWNGPDDDQALLAAISEALGKARR